MKYKRLGKGGTKVKGTSGAGIFFTDGESVLLLKRSNTGDHPDTWCLPGGGTKDSETAIGTAVRETKEEVGLDSIPGQRIDSIDTQNGRQKFTIFIYRTSPFENINLSKEHTDWKWVPFTELNKTNLHPKFEEHVDRYLRSVRRKINHFNEWVELTQIIESFCQRD